MAEPSIFSEHPNVPLLEAQKWLKSEAKTSGGAICPCCAAKQKAKGCKIAPSQAAMLVILYNNYQVGQVIDADAVAIAAGIEDLNANGLQRMVHWDLLELEPGANKGSYKLCEGGYMFVHKQFPVTPRAWIMNDEVVARDGKPATMVKILGTKFDINELLAVKFQQ